KALRHRCVELPSRTDNLSVGIGVEIEPRVHRDAMTPHRDAGMVDVTVWLRIARLDHPVDVDAMARGEDTELVREPDIDIAVGGLCQFAQLGRLSRAQVPDAVRAWEVRLLIEL